MLHGAKTNLKYWYKDIAHIRLTLNAFETTLIFARVVAVANNNQIRQSGKASFEKAHTSHLGP
jgi:hypothetical protein